MNARIKPPRKASISKHLSKLIVVVNIILLLLCLAVPSFAGNGLPYPKFKAFDTSGNPLNGGKVYTYITGTTTAKTTYTTAACTPGTENANPVILDANGEAVIYLKGIYRIVLKTSADVSMWTMDNITGMQGVSGGAFYYADSSETDQGVTGTGATLKAHIDTLAGNNGTIVLPHPSGSTTTYTLSTNLTVPSTVTLLFEKGARISVDAAKTLTVNGQVDSGEDVIFTGSGTVAGALLNTFKMSDWFSGVTDSTTVTGVLKNMGASNAQGDVFYHNGTNVTRLGAGTAGQFLKTLGTSANPAWATPTFSISGLSRNLYILNGSSVAVTVTADELLVLDSSAFPLRLSSVSETVTITTSGISGLDTGVEAVSTWYYIWIIHNPTSSTTDGLFSTSASSPTMPSGYTYKALVGVVRNDSSGDFISFVQRGDQYQYLSAIKVGDGVGSTTTASIDCSTQLPTSILKSAYGKVMSNTGALTWFYDTASFTNSLAVDNTEVPFSITFSAATQTYPWFLPVNHASTLLFHQASANTVDIWVSGFSLR